MNLNLSAPQGYGKHETGGEHAMKHMHDPYEFCRIRQSTFGDGIAHRDPTEILHIMQEERDGGLLNVLTSDARHALAMVGGAFYRNEFPHGKRIISVDASDVVLASEHRRRGAGSWLLSRLMMSGGYYHARGQSQMFATDLSITDDNAVMADWQRQKAQEIGMAQRNGRLHYYLPGPYAHVKNPIGELAGTLEQVELHKYTGSIPFSRGEAEPDRRYVFRQGMTIGWVQRNETNQDNLGDFCREYLIKNMLDDTSYTQVLHDELFAITSLLNTSSVREQLEAMDA